MVQMAGRPSRLGRQYPPRERLPKAHRHRSRLACPPDLVQTRPCAPHHPVCPRDLLLTRPSPQQTPQAGFSIKVLRADWVRPGSRSRASASVGTRPAPRPLRLGRLLMPLLRLHRRRHRARHGSRSRPLSERRLSSTRTPRPSRFPTPKPRPARPTTSASATASRSPAGSGPPTASARGLA